MLAASRQHQISRRRSKSEHPREGEKRIMAYQNNRRRSSSSTASRWMTVRYSGTCKVCGQTIAAGSTAFWDAAAKTLTCERIDCCEADGLVTREPRTGPWDKRTDLRKRAERRIGAARSEERRV